MKRSMCVFVSVMMALSPVALAVPVPPANLGGEATLALNGIPLANGSAPFALINEIVTLTVTSTGTVRVGGNLYQWYQGPDGLVWAEMTGENGDSLIFSSGVPGIWYFKCLVTNRSGAMYSVIVKLSIITHTPVLRLVYNTAQPTMLSCRQDNGGILLENLCPANGSWATAGISKMGIRFVETAKLLAGNIIPPVMNSGDGFIFSVTEASINGFNGKIAPYFIIGGNKYLSRLVETVTLEVDGGPQVLLSKSGDGYFLLNLIP